VLNWSILRNHKEIWNSTKIMSSMQWDPVWQLYRPLGDLPYDIRQQKVLDIAIDEVSGALSIHAVPPAIRTIVVPT
jgi:hypothetical protein